MGEISQSVQVNGFRITALLDSGATSNYISKSVAKILNLRLGADYAFKGIDGLKHIGKISYITLKIFRRIGSTEVVVTDVLPQDGYNLILGQTFLQDNEVVLDFKKDKFKFGKHQPKINRIGRI